jgi:very-short-patch-repair endonuclease
MRLYYGLDPADRVIRGRLPVTTIAKTVAHLAYALSPDDLVCLLDSALRAGWSFDASSLSARRATHLRAAVERADVRSESALETRARLILVGAGLAPEAVQFHVYSLDDVEIARLDFAWPSCLLAVELDGREHHDDLPALYRDRVRQNDLVLAGWTVLRFTWYDVVRRPKWVVAQVRAALARSAA